MTETLHKPTAKLSAAPPLPLVQGNLCGGCGGFKDTMKYRLEQDTDAENPRESFDNAGKMVCWHRRYNLGDKHSFDSPADFDQWWKENGDGGVLLPLRLFDHSGLSMSIGYGAHEFDPGGWDSGQVGWIYATRETILKEWGKGNRITAKARKQAEDYLRGEVETFDQYLTGDVWGFIVEDDDGNHLDSCWGFYGSDYCEQEAKQALAHCEKHALAEANNI